MSDAVTVALISGAVTVVAVGVPSIISARNSGHAKKNTTTSNGQNLGGKIDDLHHLFVKHETRDDARFSKLEINDGALTDALMELHDYSHKRWHRDDNRQTVLLLMLSIAFDPTIPANQKADTLKELQKRYREAVVWDGSTERRHSDT